MLTVDGAALDTGFYGDDFIWLYNASRVQAPLDLFVIHDAPFAHYDMGFLWPLSNLFFYVGWHLFGLEPAGYHAVALGLCVTTAWLLSRWVTDVSGRFEAGVVASVAFVVYPGHWEPTIWLASIGEVLAGLMTMLCLHAWWRCRWHATHRLAWGAVALASMVAAALAKESALYLPVVLTLIDVWLCPPAKNRLRQAGNLLAMWGAAAAVAAWKAFSVWSVRGSLGPSPVNLSPRDLVIAVAQYVTALLFVPGVGERTPVPTLTQAGVALALALIVTVGLLRRGLAAPAVHLAWLVLATGAYALLVPGAPLRDRYTWQASLPLAALLGLAVTGASALMRQHVRNDAVRSAMRGGVWIAVAGSLIVCGARARESAVGYARLHPPSLSDARARIEAALQALGPQGHVYVYVQPNVEDAPAREVILLSGLTEDRVRDWYDLLHTPEGPLEGDVMLFWDEWGGTFVDLTDAVKRAWRKARGRVALPRLAPHHEARDAAIAFAVEDLDRRPSNEEWRVYEQGLAPLPCRELSPRCTAISGPVLNMSPWRLYMVAVRYETISPSSTSPPWAPSLGWSSPAEGGFGPSRLVSGTRTRQGREEVAVYFPSARPAWWTMASVERLFLWYDQEPAIRVNRVELYGLPLDDDRGESKR